MFSSYFGNPTAARCHELLLKRSAARCTFSSHPTSRATRTSTHQIYTNKQLLNTCILPSIPPATTTSARWSTAQSVAALFLYSFEISWSIERWARGWVAELTKSGSCLVQCSWGIWRLLRKFRKGIRVLFIEARCMIATQPCILLQPMARSRWGSWKYMFGFFRFVNVF